VFHEPRRDGASQFVVCARAPVSSRWFFFHPRDTSWDMCRCSIWEFRYLDTRKEILSLTYCTDLAKNCYAILIFDILHWFSLLQNEKYQIFSIYFGSIGDGSFWKTQPYGFDQKWIKSVKIIKLKEKSKIYYESQRKFNAKLSLQFLLPLFTFRAAWKIACCLK